MSKEVPVNRIAVLAFAFGSPSAIGSNRFLTNAAKGLVEYGKAGTILTQREIGLKYMPDDVVEYISDKPLAEPTLRIAEWMVRRAIESKFQVLIIVAASPHIGRCLRDTEYVVKKSGANIHVSDYRIFKEDIVGDYESMSWFCKESIQPRTRSYWAWWSREIILLGMPMPIYTQIAG